MATIRAFGVDNRVVTNWVCGGVGCCCGVGRRRFGVECAAAGVQLVCWLVRWRGAAGVMEARRGGCGGDLTPGALGAYAVMRAAHRLSS